MLFGDATQEMNYGGGGASTTLKTCAKVLYRF